MVNDTFKSRVYAAETLASTDGCHYKLDTIDDARVFIRWVEDMPDFRERYPKYRVRVKVTPTKNPKSSKATYANAGHEILLPGWGIEMFTCLHELAHAVTPIPFPDHGVEFVQNLLWLVAAAMEPGCHATLRKALVAKGVPLEHNLQKVIYRNRHMLRVGGMDRQQRERWDGVVDPKVRAKQTHHMWIVTADGKRRWGDVAYDSVTDEAVIASHNSSKSDVRIPLTEIRYVTR